MQELLKDYAINKQFRRDIYVKGPQRLNAREQRQRLGEMILVKTQMSDAVPEKFQLPIGELKPKPEIMAELMKGIGLKPMTGDEVIAAAVKAGLKEPTRSCICSCLSTAAPCCPRERTTKRSSANRRIS